MPPASKPAAAGQRPHLVLVGLGGVHRHLLARADRLRKTYDITLVAPADTMAGCGPATAFTGHRLHPLRRVSAGLDWLQTRVAKVAPLHHRVVLADGSRLHYDRLSLAIGTSRELPATITQGQGRGQSTMIHAGHSPAALWQLARQLNGGGAPQRLVVLGGSAQALAIIEALVRRRDLVRRPDLCLLWPEIETTKTLYRRFSRLIGQGVTVARGVVPEQIDTHRIRAVDGRRFAADRIVWAGPPALSSVAQSLARADDRQGLRVDRHFLVPGPGHVFASGAMTLFNNGARAADQAEVLGHNLLASIDGGGMKRYRPSRRERSGNIG